MPRDRIESLFSKLKDESWGITSAADIRYNCVAWASGDTENWWQPRTLGGGSFWPHDNHELTLDSFLETFTIQGYELCESPELERDYEKVALYADDLGVPSHVARQRDDGIWTSKLGELEDIIHTTLESLSGTYGSVRELLRGRRVPAS
jgi:hypothetical protein